MDSLVALILAAVALEATVEILRNIWDADVRARWNISRLVVVAIAVVAVVVFSNEWTIVAGTGLDIDNIVIGQIITGLALARVVYWVHDFYKKTAG
jgi:hypothetical protein